jgi:hypothetical protein
MALPSAPYLLSSSRRHPLEKRRSTQLHALCLVDLVCAAVLALCYTNDIFTAYVFNEICAMASCGLHSHPGERRALVAAIRYMISNPPGLRADPPVRHPPLRHHGTSAHAQLMEESPRSGRPGSTGSR